MVVPIHEIFVIDESFFSLFATVTMKSNNVFFSFSLLNTEINSFSTIMQLINRNYNWKNSQTNKDYTVNIVALVSSTSLLRTQIMQSKCGKIEFSFYFCYRCLPFVIYLSGFDLFSLSNFFKIPMMGSLDIFTLKVVSGSLKESIFETRKNIFISFRKYFLFLR